MLFFNSRHGIDLFDKYNVNSQRRTPMSGAKRTYVSVEDRELRRLREQESRLRQVQQDLPDRIDAVRRQAQQEMQNRLRPIEDRQRRQEKMVGSLKSDLVSLEKDTQKRLKQQRKEFMGCLKDQRGEYLQIFKEQDIKFTRMVDSERNARQHAVDNLQNQINAIVADADRKQDAAASFVSDLSKIMTEMETLPHERFAPGEIDTLRRHVEDAQRSVNAGMPEAALSTAQSAFWELADLRALVQAREAEFMLLYQAALEETRALLEEARSHRKYQLDIGIEGKSDTIEMEVDHWSHGALSEQEAKIKAVEARLLSEADSLTIEETRELLSELEAEKPVMTDIVEQAKQNILASQLRVNIADMAVEAFQAQGFTVADETYEGEDQRNAYVVKMINVAGSEVVTVISPVPGEMGRNEVSVHSYDQTYVDDATLRQRAEELVSVLREEGLETGTPSCSGKADPEYQDMEQVRQRRPEQVRREARR